MNVHNPAFFSYLGVFFWGLGGGGVGLVGTVKKSSLFKVVCSYDCQLDCSS